MKQPAIRDLAVISDRNTCALIDSEATISWYCPGRFDADALMSSILDETLGGYWQIHSDEKSFVERQFENRSSVLHTYFTVLGKGFTVTDFMPVGVRWKGICRLFSAACFAIENEIRFGPDFGLNSEEMVLESSCLLKLVTSSLWLASSHPISVQGEVVSFSIPAGETGWAALTDRGQTISAALLDEVLKDTLKAWEEIETYVDYHGPYENQVRNSLRALQQMVYAPTGGIIAAATTSLPEVIGGERNYDYRYVWMRDAALITAALVQVETNGKLENSFISFVAASMRANQENHVSCFYGIDHLIKTKSFELPLAGFQQSRPVQVGNPAWKQFQLDAEANILIACKLIYDKHQRIEWQTVENIADYICKNWESKDNGVWEESQQQHYTTSKAFAARALELLAPYHPDKKTAQRWLKNASMIRDFIKKNCLTSSGAYAVHAGSDKVDITAALFVPFGFDEFDSPAIIATIAQLEAQYSDKGLYRRTLLEFDSAKEGVFLATSCWMAHYYCIAGNLIKARQILDALLCFSNDLGYFSEQGNTATGAFLGNFPQTFVHSSFICAVQGYKKALAGQNSVIR